MSLSIGHFAPGDLPAFMGWAEGESWVCDQWEFDFLLRESAAGCFVIRREGEALAFVTAIAYGSSGWIGNLLVSPGHRRLGLGRWLMHAALLYLGASGVECVWLTASPEGAPLYGALGFREVDRIERWCGEGRPGLPSPGRHMAMADQVAIDAGGWGEARTSLLREKRRHGQLWHTPLAFLAGQGIGAGYQIGPCGGDTTRIAPLLDAALEGRGRVLLDVPAANVEAARLLTLLGFRRRGGSVMMCRGDASGYDPSRVFALGSMGSIG